MKKRTLICLGLVCVLAVSCGTSVETTDNSDNLTDSETSVETPEVSYYDLLGDKDFGGKEFTVIGVHYAARRNFADEEATGEIVNDALKERDDFISDKYNVNLTFVAQDNGDTVASIVKNSVLADEDNYNLVIGNIASNLRGLMTGGILADMNTLPTLDLSREWWSPNMYENTQLDGKIYITMGDISPQKYYAPYVMAYNQKLAEDYGFPDMYALVLDGGWTIDEMSKLTKDKTHDLNGDTVIDYDDFLAYAYVKTNITGMAHYTGAGGKLSSSSGSDIAIDIGTERSVNIIEKLQALLDETGIAAFNSEIDNKTIAMFMEDRALFYGNSMSQIISNFRDMNSDFGIIPVPKYDADQEDYYAYINTWCLGGCGVPKTVRDSEMTGFIMEALCYKSYEIVRPAICEVLLKQKVSRSDANVQ